MSVTCGWYALLVLLTCTLWPGLAGHADQEAQIERPRELLRHQQNHRPSFIERKLVDRLEMHESATTEPAIGFEDREDASDEKNDGRTIPSKPKLVETSIERPATQIRHGRSRSHFARQVRLDDPDSSFASDGSGRRTQATDNASRIETVSNLDRSRGKNVITGQDLRSSGTIDERSTVDLDKLLTRLSEAGSDKRKEGRMRHKGDSLNKLRKVIARNRSRLSGNRTAGNSSEIYGHVVHGAPSGDRSDLDDVEIAILEDYDVYDSDGGKNSSESEDYEDYGKDGDQGKSSKEPVHVDIVTRFLRIIENQHLLGENCTAGTDLNLGEGIVDQYAQERFRLEANLAVNRANMLTRLWKYAPEVMLSSEYLLHASILSMVEFDEDIFAAGNCYDKLQYRDRWLYCPFAHRLQDQDGILVKDLAMEYKYLSNSSEWFYIARKNAERVIANNDQFSRGESASSLVVDLFGNG
ncbi:hypothetical protein K0M31_008282 [Melipona bicolor]|uniref:Uncharacterized protein n=1 Tax=Melipona bicolor TaxID=60889 RepID=A0AA40KKN6_9HYME|nr:hypothetical protein K0M31_008282 [Melipona bicolor]